MEWRKEGGYILNRMKKEKTFLLFEAAYPRYKLTAVIAAILLIITGLSYPEHTAFIIKLGFLTCLPFGFIADKLRKSITNLEGLENLSNMKRSLVRLLSLFIALCLGFIYSFPVIALNNMFNAYR